MTRRLVNVLWLGCCLAGGCRPVPDSSSPGERPGPPVSRPSEASPESSLTNRELQLVFGRPKHVYPLPDAGASGEIRKMTAPTPVKLSSVPDWPMLSGFQYEQPDRERTVLSLPLQPSESLWGLGERFDAWDQRGRVIECWAEDMAQGGPHSSYFAVPFIISSEGYGLFVNGTGRVRFDCGASQPDRMIIAVPDTGAEVYLFRGAPAEVSARYTRRVGRPRLPPDWVFQPWLSRNSYLSAYEIDRTLDRMEQHGLTVGVVVLEAWAESLQNFRFQARRYPDPGRWIESLHRRGVRVVLWETPSIWTNSSTYAEARERDLLVRTADGSELVLDWLENGRKIDFRNPAARAWWTALHEPLVALGVDGFKTDGGERHPDPNFHNQHPNYYQQAVQAAFERGGRDGITFSRSANPLCAGSGLFWAGDQHADGSSLPRVVRAGLAAALSGFPYWSHDIGGYTGQPDPALYARWLQLGTFSPIMQLHGIAAREPWWWGEEMVELARYYFSVRHRLQPYLREAAARAHTDGIPMWRPLIWDFPDDPEARNVDDQFLLGPDLLIAPVLDEEDRRRVYLPAGRWTEVWTTATRDGPVEFEATVPRHQIPIYIRAERYAELESLFPAWAPVPPPDVSFRRAGDVNDRGLAPRFRVVNGQPYVKLFCTLVNRGPAAIQGQAQVVAPGVATVPDTPLNFVAPAGGESRLAFYATGPTADRHAFRHLAPGSYPVQVRAVTSEAVYRDTLFTLVKCPTWFVAGPFPELMDQPGPMDGRSVRMREAVKGRDGVERSWTRVEDEQLAPDGYIDLGRILGSESGPTAYAYTELSTPTPRTFRFYAGSGDGLMMWVNGRLLLDRRAHRAPEADEDEVEVPLSSGTHAVLLRITHEIGPHGFYFRLE
jgi:alpha-D-xyloside xylohydrolase